MPTDRVLDYTMEKCEPLYEEDARMSALAFMPNQTIVKGTILGQVSDANANEVQTINYTGAWATADTITLSIVGVDGGTYSTTVTFADDAITAAAMKTAIEGLLTAAGYIGATVTVANDAPTDQTVTFGGTAAYWDMPLMTAAYETAGEGTVTVDATTPGVRTLVWGPYSDTATDGRQVAKAIAVYSFRTDYLGRVVYATSGTSPEHMLYYQSAPAWFKGRFSCADLTGLDANAVTDLGRLESGTTSAGVLALI